MLIHWPVQLDAPLKHVVMTRLKSSLTELPSSNFSEIGSDSDSGIDSGRAVDVSSCEERAPSGKRLPLD